MSGFLYFIPKWTRPITQKDVKTFGLGYAFENPPLAGLCHNNTPTKTQGSVFADKARHGEGRIKMDMEAQVWRKMPRPGQEDVYIGFWRDAPPGPEDLKRANQLGGYLLAMHDGQKWTAPLVRFFDKASERLGSALPSKMSIAENGDIVPGEVIDRYQHLYDAMDKYVGAMQSGNLIDHLESLPLSTVCRDARTLLQANYVIDLPEIEILGLWQIVGSDECMEAVATIWAAIDFKNYFEWEEISKKKTPSPAAAVG